MDDQKPLSDQFPVIDGKVIGLNCEDKMKKQAVLTVKQYPMLSESASEYQVKKVVNSVEWDVNSYLSKKDLKRIMDNRVRPTKVVIQ